MTFHIQMQKKLWEITMNIKISYITLGMFLLLNIQGASARWWSEYVKDGGGENTESDRITEVFDSKKTPFKNVVKEWEGKEYQEDMIKYYETMGIDREFVEKALNQRLKMSKDLIASDFKTDWDISPALDFLDNRVATMNRISKLGYERLEKLAKKYDMKISKDFYQCLCSAKGIAGSSRSFSPEPDNQCNNSDPCKGGNWGCASSDFPTELKLWASCAKSHPMEGKVNIFQSLDKYIDTSKKYNQDELARKLFDRTQKFKDSCLPYMDAKNIEDIQNKHKMPVTKKATDIAEQSENICEEAVAVSLYLNSEKRTTTSEAFAEGLWSWAPINPNYADIADYGTKKLLAEGAIKKAAGKYLPVISKVMNIADNINLLKRVYNEQEADAQYKEAYKLFIESKNMSDEGLDKYQQIMESKLTTLKDKISTSEQRYFEQMKYAVERLDEKIQMNQHSNNAIRYDQASIDALWREFTSDQEAKKKLYEDKKAQMLAQYTELSLYQSVIKDFRKPMREKGCDEFIKDRIQQCKEEAKRISRQTTIGQG